MTCSGWIAVSDPRDGMLWIHSFALDSLAWRGGAPIRPTNSDVTARELVRYPGGFAIRVSDGEVLLVSDSVIQ